VLELELEDFGALVVSWLDVLPDGAAVLDDEDAAGALESVLEGVLLLELELDGVLVEPAPAEPLMVVELDEELGAGAVLSFLLMSTEVEDELEPAGAAGVAAVPPADDEDDEPAGARVAPDGAEVVLEELEARSLVRSQAAINEAPSARETATAIVESLMRPPGLGYKLLAANIGPRLLNH
jgi:hypothetical protein